MSQVFAPSLLAVALLAAVYALTYGGGAYVTYRLAMWLYRRMK